MVEFLSGLRFPNGQPAAGSAAEPNFQQAPCHEPNSRRLFSLLAVGAVAADDECFVNIHCVSITAFVEGASEPAAFRKNLLNRHGESGITCCWGG